MYNVKALHANRPVCPKGGMFSAHMCKVELPTNEKGCLSATGYQDIDDENTFYLVEQWRTQNDMDDYLKQTVSC